MSGCEELIEVLIRKYRLQQRGVAGVLAGYLIFLCTGRDDQMAAAVSRACRLHGYLTTGRWGHDWSEFRQMPPDEPEGQRYRECQRCGRWKFERDGVRW